MVKSVSTVRAHQSGGGVLQTVSTYYLSFTILYISLKVCNHDQIICYYKSLGEQLDMLLEIHFLGKNLIYVWLKKI